MNLIIPPFGIRERCPPPWKATACVEGWLKWELINRQGRVTRGGEQHNLILNQGLDQIATYGVVNLVGTIGETNPTSGIRYAAVGTDNSAPAVTDTALGAELARTNVGPDGLTVNESISRSGDGVYDHVRTFEFDFAAAIGNLTEWGISPSATAGSNLYARELFRDGGGSPEPVTKTADDKLRLVYTRRTTITPTGWTSGSLVITGHATVNGNYRLIGGDENGPSGYMDLRVFSYVATGTPPSPSPTNNWDGGALWLPSTNQSALTYAYSTAVIGDANNPAVGMAVHQAAAAYVPGSYERTGMILKYLTNRGNFEHYGIAIAGAGRDNVRFGRVGFIFDYDDGKQWTKDNLHELRVTLPTVSWARG